MSSFYSRYVPSVQPKNEVAVANDQSPKRKRVGSEHIDGPQGGGLKRVKTEKKKKGRELTQEDKKGSETRDRSGGDVLEKYSISRHAQRNTSADVTIRKRRIEPANASDKTEDLRNIGITSDLQEKPSTKYAGVLSKFGKSRSGHRQRDDAGNGQIETESSELPLEKHGLEPIPQPEIGTVPAVKPTYSTLPAWQSNALQVDTSRVISFQELGVGDAILASLEKHNINDAFPVQSTVIPLLLQSNSKRSSDLCVSAATGSGKTLAYVVPIIEALRKQKHHAFRAVIVVPTRELVKQVRDTCEMCASGSSLRVVTAVGSKSLKAEQQALMEGEEVYDPAEYQRQRSAPINYTEFDLAAEFEKVRVRPPDLWTNYVTKVSVKADILVTTPGRLVDHLKNTKGFTLDDLEWLVVDEADRLLNESYQEWIETVVPALQSRNATKQVDRALTAMRMDLPPRRVRKILLSATMTRDISKLNELELNNPKLIVLGTAGEAVEKIEDIGTAEPEADASGYFHIPASLQETAITFKDGNDKPLVLLKLLHEQVLNHVPSVQKKAIQNGMTEDSSSSESDSESDSDDSSSDSATSLSSSEEDSEGSEGSEDDSSDSASSSDDSTSDSESDSSTDTDTESDQSTSNDGRKEKSKSTSTRLHIKPRNSTNNDIVSNNKNLPPRALIFTRSTASAARLSRLLSLLLSPPQPPPSSSSKYQNPKQNLNPNPQVQIPTLTRSTTTSSQSRKSLSSFQKSHSQILIATDRASRGIDIPNLDHVINYDIPGSALNYVHRVGRTARAGQIGHAWSLVEHREGRWFWNEIGGKSSSPNTSISEKEKNNKEGGGIRRGVGRNVKKIVVDSDFLVSSSYPAVVGGNGVQEGGGEDLRKRYEDALRVLGEEVLGQR